MTPARRPAGDGPRPHPSQCSTAAASPPLNDETAAVIADNEVAAVLRDRLERQVQYFLAAGYRIETRTGMSATLIRRSRRRLRGALAVAALERVKSIAFGPVHQRVQVAVDPNGEVDIRALPPTERRGYALSVGDSSRRPIWH